MLWKGLKEITTVIVMIILYYYTLRKIMWFNYSAYYDVLFYNFSLIELSNNVDMAHTKLPIKITDPSSVV